MDNHKLVTISQLGKLLGFDHTHENKIFLFFYGEINLKILRFFLNISKKTWYFNTIFVSYIVNIQPEIMQNW
jgi:hypothetical protein